MLSSRDRSCGGGTYLQEVIAQGRARVILEGVEEAEAPPVAAIIPVLPVARLQRPVQVSRAFLVPQLDLGTHPPRETPEEALCTQS